MARNNSLMMSRQEDAQQRKQQIQEEVKKAGITFSREQQKLAERIVREITESIREESDDEILAKILQKAEEYCGDYRERQYVIRCAQQQMLGYGPLDELMNDPDITDIDVRGWDCVYVDRVSKGKQKTAVRFISVKHLETIAKTMAMKSKTDVSYSRPSASFQLEDGSRVEMAVYPLIPSNAGAYITIRRFVKKIQKPEDYIRSGAMTEPMLDFLKCCVQGKVNIFVSGGTAAGKTTLLNMLADYVPDEEKIVTLEDTRELQLNHPDVCPYQTIDGYMDLTGLLKISLRVNPDRIVVGEVRGGEVFEMLDALSTGHEGGMSTGHADNPKTLIQNRFPAMMGQSPECRYFSEKTRNLFIMNAIQLIVQIGIVNEDGEFKRKVTEITEVTDVNSRGEIRLTPIFRYNVEKRKFERMNTDPERIRSILAKHYVILPEHILSRKKGGIS